MYAIIEDSGSQIRVGEGDVFQVDVRDLDDGQKTLEFDRVLLVGGDEPKIGSPYVEGARVTAEVLDRVRAEKVIVTKFKRRKKYRRKYGHRQQYLKLKVTGITS